MYLLMSGKIFPAVFFHDYDFQHMKKIIILLTITDTIIGFFAFDRNLLFTLANLRSMQ